ncbi:ABC transporter permease subunit [Natrialbaceae archaeon A-CW3]
MSSEAGSAAFEEADKRGEKPASRRHEHAPGSVSILSTIVRRELHTVARTPTFYVLAVALTVVLLGVAWAGGGVRAGYVPTIVDLLTPLELLVPIVAVAFGYRAILADTQRGELEVLGTYPVSAWQVVLGVYVGRAAGLLVAIVGPLLIVFAAVALTEQETIRIYATHTGADSPLLFLRLIVLAAAFALVVLAVAVAISAVASTARSALALAVIALLGLLLAGDLAIIYGFSAGLVGDGSLIYTLALSPLSAFRGLVLETAVIVASGTGPRTAAPLASLLGLMVWTAGSLAVATVALDRA